MRPCPGHVFGLVLVLVLLATGVVLGQAPLELFPGGPRTIHPSIGAAFGTAYRKPVDVDGDGKHDLLKVSPWEINVALGLGNHDFQPWLTTVATPQACWLNMTPYAVADFDGDGWVDVVMAVETNSAQGCLNWAVYLYKGLGNGAFQGPVTVQDYGTPSGAPSNIFPDVFATSADPNLPSDLIIAKHLPPQNTLVMEVWSWQNGGFVILGSTNHVFSGSGFYTMGTGDFNGDGIRDVIGDFWDQVLLQNFHFLLLGSGTAPHFSSPTFFPPPSVPPLQTDIRPEWIVDADGDGDDDIIGFTDTWNTLPQLPRTRLITTLHGDPQNPLSAWTFTVITDPCPIFPPTMFVGDWDMDSAADVMVALNPPSGNCWPAYGALYAFYRGVGDGSFKRGMVVDLLASNLLGPGILADSDQDGDLDWWTAVDGWFPRSSPNLTLTGHGHSPTGGPPPMTRIGVATPGNAGFFIGVEGAPPLATTLLALSSSQASFRPPIPGLLLSTSRPDLILPRGPLGWTMTDASGKAEIALPLAPDPALEGMVFYLQALVWPTPSANPFVSPMRRIVIW